MKRFAGIRAQVTVITVVVTLVAMVGVVGLSAYAAWSSMQDIINQSLVERLDRAQPLVEKGEFQQAIDLSGIDLLQVIDANGKVIASSENLQGYSAIANGGDDSYQVDDLELDEDDDDDDLDGDFDDDADDRAGAANVSAPSGAGKTNAAPAYEDDDDADDADDDDAVSHAAKSGGTAKRSSDADDDDDDGDDGGNAAKSGAVAKQSTDDDDDDDDDDDKAKSSKAKKLFWFPWKLGVTQAFAAEAKDVRSVEVSSILGTPGPFLVMERTAKSPIGTVTLAAMTSLHPAAETALQTARWVGTLLLILLVLAAFFAWRMTGRTLRPVDRMRSEVEAISARDLSARVTPPANDPDLSRLAVTFNGLLARIQASVDEQKRFVSDASHELKSPIASTGLILETLRNHPESVEDAEVLADLTAENTRLSQIVGDLLVLARQDEGRLAVELLPVDFYDLLYEEIDSLRQRSTVTVDTSGIAPVIGECDPTLFSHTVRNLLDNAARYASSQVKVTCAERDGFVRVTVSDDGPGIPPEDRERVFGRFVRLEEGRERKKGSTGLGLSVVRGNVERLGGRVYFAEPEIGGATAVVELPLQHEQ
ncbi:MAG: ATP-binding protein [Coriobacteriia bacterium]|nr:ATP-binding protein [Coriobacteriia bacterium]